MPNPYIDGIQNGSTTIDIYDAALRNTIGQANGLATLDANGKLPSTQLPSETTTSISGNPISISGLKSNQLAINPIITFEPIQAGSGTPSPSNVRAISGYDKIEVLSCGKNIIKTTIDSLKANNTSSQGATWSGNVCTIGNTVFTVLLDNNGDVSGIKVTGSSPASGYTSFKLTFPTYKTLDKYGYEVGKAYTLSGCPSGGGTGANYNLIWNSGNAANISDTGNGAIFGVNTTSTYYLEIRIYSGYTIPSAGLMFYPMTEEGTTKTTFEPYHKTTDLSESLGQTVYGGTLDLRSGKLTVKYGMVDLGDLTWDYSAQFSLMYANMPNNAPTPVYGGNLAICSMYDCYTGSYSGQADKTFTLCNTSWFETKTVAIKDTSYSDPTAFKTAVTGQTLVYGLATPIEIQLTPHEISLLKDYAYVSTNGTNIALDYHNGEMASLADVAQVGETLNNLGDALPLKFKQVYLSASVIGTSFSPTAKNVGSIANLFGEGINQNIIAGITIYQALLNPASILHIGFFNNSVFIAATQNTVLDGGFWVNILYVEDK